MNDNYEESFAHVLTPKVEGAARKELIDKALAAIEESPKEKKDTLETRLADAAYGTYKIELTSMQRNNGQVEYQFAVVEPIMGYPINILLLPIVLRTIEPGNADEPADE